MERGIKFTDNINLKQYELVKFNAIELSEIIKKNLPKDTYKVGDGVESMAPYEYQNFFLLREDDGSLILLDGFRRLIISEVPDITINARIYDRKDFTNQELIEILINLNHFKFVSNIGNFYDNGFALFMQLVMKLKIKDIRRTLETFLINEGDYKVVSWRSYGGVELKNYEFAFEAVIKNMKHKYFFEDIQFLTKLQDSDIYYSNNVAAMLRVLRNEHDDYVFDFDKMKEKVLVNPMLMEKINKYQASKNKDARYDGTQTDIIEGYKNILTELNGGESAQKSISEVAYDLRQELNKIKKTHVKIAGGLTYTGIRLTEKILKNKKDEPIKVKAFLIPNESCKLMVNAGIYDTIEYVRSTYHFTSGNTDHYKIKVNSGEYFDFRLEAGKITITNGWGTTSKYESYTLEVYIEMTKKELKELKEKV